MSIENGPQLHSFTTNQPNVLVPVPVAQETEDNHGNTTIHEEGNETQATDDANNSYRDDTVEDQSLEKDRDLTPLIHADDEVEEENPDDDDDGGDGDDDDDDDDDDVTGTSVLPLSRIKKIFKTDPEHVSASEAAVFTSAIATELFIQYFTEQASLIARSEKRKKLQYKDFAAAVANIEQLHFLSDTVPKTYNLKKLVDENKIKYNESSSITSSKAKPLSKGQSTLNFKGKGTSKLSKAIHEDPEELPESDDDQDVGEGADIVGFDSDIDTEEQKDKDTDDDTDEELENSNDHIRKDKDHDVIMD